MDVVALRSDELRGPDELTPVPAAAGDRRMTRRPWLVAPYFVLVGLLALLGLLLVQRSDDRSRDAARTSAVAAGRQEALALTSISFQHPLQDLNRIIAGATGQLAREFTAQRAQLPAALQRIRSTSAGTVLAAGLVQLSSNAQTAKVSVAVDATVSTQPASGPAQSSLKHYRMVITLQKLHGRWLASDVAFAGAPQ